VEVKETFWGGSIGENRRMEGGGRKEGRGKIKAGGRKGGRRKGSGDE